MGYIFTKSDFERISGILEKEHQDLEKSKYWRISNDETHQSLALSIYNKIDLGKDYFGSMVSVQTNHGYFELHDCIGFIVFEPDEIIFVQYSDDKISGLIISKQCNCSMYANIRREVLSCDFGSLEPAVLLSAMQLSLTESIIS